MKYEKKYSMKHVKSTFSLVHKTHRKTFIIEAKYFQNHFLVIWVSSTNLTSTLSKYSHVYCM